MLENNPYIDKFLVLNAQNTLRLEQEKFDILFSLEITTPATLLANIVQADEKYGYYFNEGATFCFNKGAEEYLETAFLTNKKLKNRKSYQELIFQACELPYNKEEIIFELADASKKYAEEFRSKNNLKEKDKILGINFSAGERWASKSLSSENLKELVRRINSEYKIILLGGPEEEQKLKQISQELKNEGIAVVTNNPNNSVGEFASILSLCDKIITTDSFALHLSLALKKPTIALFFSTPYWEIEDYGVVKKIYSPLLSKYFLSKNYSEELASSISVQEILKELNLMAQNTNLQNK